MKSVLPMLLLFLFSLTSSVVYGQDLAIGNNYFFISNLGTQSSELMKINGRKAIASEEICRGHIVKIVDLNDKEVFFEYLRFGKKEDKATEKQKALQKIYNFENETTKIFSLSKEDFKRLTKDFYNFWRGFEYGVYTLPIRLRRQSAKFEFDANVSLGANVVLGIGNRKKDYSFVDLSLGVGITKVDLDSENSMLGDSTSIFESIEVLSPTAFTISFGAVFNLAKNINIGLYAGWDKLSSADNEADWIYNGKPWGGIGLNIVFSNKKEASASQNTSNN